MTAPGVHPRELVLASAGSGKTFRISSRIIGLLAGGAPAEEVFASTFTRKAAGEILARVLERLSSAALDDDAARALSEHALGDDAGAALDRAGWLEVLERLVRGLDRVNVGTLDAFFVRMAGAFGQEAGLPPGWRIADEAEFDRIRAEALERLLRAGDRETLLALLRALNNGQARRSVHEAIARQADDLVAIQARLDPLAPDPWRAMERALGGASAPAEADRLRLAEAVRAAPVPRTAAGAPNRNWARCLESAAGALEQADWPAFVENSLTSRILAAEDHYDRRAIDAEVAALFEAGIRMARASLGARLAEQGRALGALAGHLAEAFERRQRETGGYRFDDVTRLLGGGGVWRRSDVHYRMDARLRHVLLDEFQDTSLAQWQVLQPLMDEVLARPDGAAAVVVADPKQSIYGWRGGEPLLVDHVAAMPTMDTAPPLALSWRSSQVVLDAVNRVFQGIAGSAALDDDGRDTAAAWAASFTPHTAARALPGYVRVAAGPRGDGRSDLRPELCEAAAHLVGAVRTQAPGFTIGVLTRTNAAVARTIFELGRLGIEASEEGGNPLTDSPAVGAVLALFRLADHPGDRIARYHVARSPVGEVVGLAEPEDAATARRVADAFRRRLVEDGYGAALEWLAARLAPACDARDLRRLGQLVERGYRYEPRASLRPADFARTVAAERVEDPFSADVRVMTVHQAKGLEFDVVVLPQLDVALASRGSDGPLAFHPHPVGGIAAVYPPMNEATRNLFGEVEALRAAHAQRCAAALRDGLSGLYVALTRARHALHVLVAADGERPSQAKTLARVVREALAPGIVAAEGDVLYESGDPRWHRHLEAPPSAGARGSAEAVGPVRLAARTHRTRLLPRRTASGHADGGVDLSRVLAPDGGRPIAGRVAHAWLEAIGWLDDGVPPDDALRAAALRAAPGMDAAQVDRLLARFRGWLEAPEVRGVLSRGRYPADVVLERETPFVRRDGDALMEGVIDRLVLVREGGRVVRAEVVDFKTDALDGADAGALGERVERYRAQMEAYRRAVSAAYRLAPARVAASLVLLQAGRVVEVAADTEGG